MPTYKINFTKKAEKQLAKIDVKNREKIAYEINKLSIDPRPTGCKQLSTGDYRIRQGDYRIIYDIHDYIITITVLAVGHRKAIYR